MDLPERDHLEPLRLSLTQRHLVGRRHGAFNNESGDLHAVGVGGEAQCLELRRESRKRQLVPKNEGTGFEDVDLSLGFVDRPDALIEQLVDRLNELDASREGELLGKLCGALVLVSHEIVLRACRVRCLDDVPEAPVDIRRIGRERPHQNAGDVRIALGKELKDVRRDDRANVVRRVEFMAFQIPALAPNDLVLGALSAQSPRVERLDLRNPHLALAVRDGDVLEDLADIV